MGGDGRGSTEGAVQCVRGASGAGGWQALFACGGAAARYVVFERSRAEFAPSVSGVRDVDWAAPGEMPELAIVTPPRRWWPGFAEAAAPLAAFREARGCARG